MKEHFFKSSTQQILSAPGEQVEVGLRMHIFYQYVVLEYELRHSTRWLKNVQISVEPDSESFIYIGTVSPIQILGPGLSR